MKRIFLILGLVGGLASAQIKVSVAGLQVVGEGYASEGAKVNQGGGLRAFNWSSGTKVALLLKSDQKSIVGLDEAGSKVTVFGDDLGTDFTKVKSRFSQKAVNFGFSRMSEDGKALMFEVESGGIPKMGANSLVLKGELQVSVASKSALKKSEVAGLEKGTKIVVGEHTFEVLEAGKPEWGEDPMSIELQSPVDHRKFKKIIFYDVEGNEIESGQSGSGSMGGFGKTTYSVSFNLKKKVDQVIVGVERWTDLEAIKVPLDLTVRVGL